MAVLLYATGWLAAGVAVLSTAFGLTPVLIDSGSMSPLIRTGDVLLYAPDDGVGLGPGTVITYHDPSFGGRLVTHRIAGVTGAGAYVTQGDANATPDSDVVTPAAVLGTGRVVVPYVGLPVHWLREGSWLPLAAWLAATVAALSSVLGGTSGRAGTDRRRRSGSRPLWPGAGRRRRSLRARSAAAPVPLVILAASAVLAGGSLAESTLAGSSAAFTGTTAADGSSLAAGDWTALTGVAGGQEHTCAARDQGVVRCWGSNADGRLGVTSGDSTTPVLASGPAGEPLMSGVTALAAGGGTTCAVTAAGAAWCWGSNSRGQLGDGTLVSSATPVRVTGTGGTPLTSVVAVAVGAAHACALAADGSVRCWGANDRGQLGNGTTVDSARAVQVVGVGGSGTIAGIGAVAAGGEHTCAATTAGNVRCWGRNGSGQLGAVGGDQATPVTVVGSGGLGVLVDAAGVSAGEEHSCARQVDGSVSCWGSNASGQLGSTGLGGPAPVKVASVSGLGTLTAVAHLTAGGSHTCAALTDATAVCWGLNTDGRLGDGTTTTRFRPVAVAGPGGSGSLGAVRLVAAGGHATCAAATDDTLWCWGRNAQGQLGDGTTTGSAVPVRAL